MSLYDASEETGTPASPSAARQLLYPKSTGWYKKNSAGIETRLADSADLIASSIANTPAGNIVATTLQTAINELDTEKASLGANTFTGTQVLSDQQVNRAMLLDCGYTVVDKGNISNATVTFDYTGGSVQTYTATGSTVTWALSNPPPTGNEAYLLIRGTNMGAYTHTISGITWLKPDGTTTTTLATYLAANTGRTAFQTSGVDQILLWTRDAGTTWYGKLV